MLNEELIVPLLEYFILFNYFDLACYLYRKYIGATLKKVENLFDIF